jgi:hypothetical protein
MLPDARCGKAGCRSLGENGRQAPILTTPPPLDDNTQSRIGPHVLFCDNVYASPKILTARMKSDLPREHICVSRLQNPTRPPSPCHIVFKSSSPTRILFVEARCKNASLRLHICIRVQLTGLHALMRTIVPCMLWYNTRN